VNEEFLRYINTPEGLWTCAMVGVILGLIVGPLMHAIYDRCKND
jgi:hypothetical protein